MPHWAGGVFLRPDADRRHAGGQEPGHAGARGQVHRLPSDVCRAEGHDVGGDYRVALNWLGGWKVPSPLPSKTVTALEPEIQIGIPVEVPRNQVAASCRDAIVDGSLEARAYKSGQMI